MDRIKVYIFIFLFAFFLTSGAFSKSSYFNEGKTLFEKKNFSESKFKFEKAIVFDPKSEKPRKEIDFRKSVCGVGTA